MAFGAGVLAASAADTWATEIGLLAGRTPRSIVTGRPVPSGTSGGISMYGSGGAAAGALFIAAVVAAIGWPVYIAGAALAAGLFGAMLDSLIGATIQARRWCDTCGSPTERLVHVCGTVTREAGGVAWLGNDAVNLLSGIGGGVLAVLICAA